MIQSLQIKRFRCFEEVQLPDLRRINVVVGESRTGKTAFLEALFMCSGMSADLFFRTQSWRGLPDPTPAKLARGDESFRDLWREMFFKLDESKQIEISFNDSESGKRWLKIYYDEREESRSFRLTPSSAPVVSIVAPLIFEGEGKGKPFKAPVVVTSEGDISLPRFTEPHSMAFLTPATVLNAGIIAERFSLLRKDKNEGPVVQAVKRLFPDVLDLGVEIHGGSHAIFADIKDLPKRIYVGSISAGVTKFVSLLSTIQTQPKGLVAIDEIENGFYYKNLSSMWGEVVRFSKQNETQIFATTHSMEFLEAMLPAIQENTDDFCLLRTEKTNGACDVKAFSGRQFINAIEQNIEVR